jgi:hypothetical protein
VRATYKLKFGHHGGNQPVSDIDSTNVQITAQNHNYAVDEATLPANAVVTHRNLNDGTVEGAAPGRPARLLRAVSPGGQPRPARRRSALCTVCGDGEGARGARVARFGAALCCWSIHQT